MLPRKSVVVKYVFVSSCTALLLLLWLSGSDHLWDDIDPRELNETALRLEYAHLLQVVNQTTGLHGDATAAPPGDARDLYRLVRALRDRLPISHRGFRYILNPAYNVCGLPANQSAAHNVTSSRVFLLTYVHSAPEHYKRRVAIRNSWGNPGNFPPDVFRIVFLLGRPRDAATQAAIQLESDRFRDIVQEDFIDSYRNLTFKAIMGLKWVTAYCAHAQYVLKSDDDIFVNVFNLVGHVRSLRDYEGQHRRWILCLVWTRMKVVRDPSSKWYIPVSEYKKDFFPTYCSGSAFVMSTDLVTAMYREANHVPFFWV